MLDSFLLIFALFSHICFAFVYYLYKMYENDFDVEKYKTEFESDEHWELKKKFINTHKDRIAEDDLVCLAQVFVNIEFLGCRYPDETMIRVAELAKGVVEEFREKKKNTLKRTFVTASDAANSKVKGLGSGHTTLTKRPTLDLENFVTEKKQIEPMPGPLGTFVLYLTPGSSPYQMLERSLQLNRAMHCSKFEPTVLPNGSVSVKFTLLGQNLGECTGVTKKEALDLVSTAALAKLRETCYAVLLKDRLIGKSVEKSDLSENTTEKLTDDNVGSKLMKLMGWTGGGLGSSEQGRAEPVVAVTNVQRAGFGSGGLESFRTAVRQFLQQWLQGGAKSDLSFSNEFDREHRKIIHEIGLRLGVKTQSYGKDDNRRLVISKKVKPWDLVLELASGSDRCDKYELLAPGSKCDLNFL